MPVTQGKLLLVHDFGLTALEIESLLTPVELLTRSNNRASAVCSDFLAAAQVTDKSDLNFINYSKSHNYSELNVINYTKIN